MTLNEKSGVNQSVFMWFDVAEGMRTSHNNHGSRGEFPSQLTEKLRLPVN